MSYGRRLHAPLVAIALAVLAMGCGSHDRPAPAAHAPGPDWPMFGLGPTRPNATDRATGITAADLPHLRKAVVRLPGTVDSSPIVLRGVRVAGAARDVALATTTYGLTVAVDLDRAKVLWTFTPPGYDRFTRLQVTNASPAADRSRRFVYAASPDGKVHKLSVADGREASGGRWPVTVTLDPTHEKLTSSLLVLDGAVYVTTGGFNGDEPPYQGHVVRIDGATGEVDAVFNSLCSTRREIIDPKTCPSSDSAIWGRAGAVLDPTSGDLLVASSNGPFDGKVDWSDSVLRLDPATLRLNRNWTPTDVDRDEQQDLDLGSSSPVVLGDGLVLQSGKDARLHLLDAGTLNGRSGPASPRLGGELQDLPAPGRQMTFTAPAVWHHGGRTIVFVATQGATTAYVVKRRRLTTLWSHPEAGTSPVVAAGLLYVYDPTGNGLRVLEPASGRSRAVLPAGTGHWSSPVITGGHVVLPEGSVNLHQRSGVLDVWTAAR
jgi:outer membrane protein assembly factor BamB